MSNFKEKTIDGLSCRTNKFTGSLSFKLFVELLGLLGPGLTPLLGAMSKGGSASSILDMDASSLQSAILALMAKMNPESNLDLLKRVLSSTTIDGADMTDAQFDLLFQGKLLTMFKVVLFAIEVNYSDFLGEGGFQGLTPPTPPKNTTLSSNN